MPTSSIQRRALQIRKKLPERLRRVLRLARHAMTTGQSSLEIPPALLAECRVCASRLELVRLMPPRARVAEVGTYQGSFASHILIAADPVELHLIDIDLTELNEAVRADRRVVLHEGRSEAVLAGLPDAHFDWIYVDGDHSYEGVIRDANAAAHKVKPGGYLVFNDFAHIDPYLGTYGVHRAVVDFAVAQQWAFAWLAYQPDALYDVALRRPEAPGPSPG
jgi:predicted O-methyltransferase YrrM